MVRGLCAVAALVLAVGTVTALQGPAIGRGERRDGMLVAQQAPLEYESDEIRLRQARCPRSCSGHGVCAVQDGSAYPPVCNCLFMWSGLDCSVAACPLNCSGSGVCDATTGRCLCNAGLEGAACERRTPTPPQCPNDCSGNGLCNQNSHCECFSGWLGTACEIPTCRGNCSNHGLCWEPTPGYFMCACEEGWKGGDCSVAAKACPDDCSGHGACDRFTGTCECERGWQLPACGLRECASGYLNQVARAPPPYGGCPSDCNCHGYCVCEGPGGGERKEAGTAEGPQEEVGEDGHCYCACEPSWAGDDCGMPVEA